MKFKITKMNYSLKPHHFLDILKLYGSGVEKFVPARKYQHNFYKVGNIIVEKPLTVVSLTVGIDDICRPCRFLKAGKCISKIQDFIYSSKDEWNKTIDNRILIKLGLKERDELTAIELCQLARKKLKREDIIFIWKERPKKETEKRIRQLMNGLRKYKRKYSSVLKEPLVKKRKVR